MLPSTLRPIPGDSIWFTDLASTFDIVDEAFWLVYWICVVFFVIIVVAQGYFMIRYRQRPGHRETFTATHNYALELSWSVIPTLLIVVIFTYGFIGFLNLRTPPANAYDINVVAKKWGWTFLYPTGVVSNELHAEVGQPVRLVMASDDVLHSLFIRDFRVKQDIVPGRYSYLWFEATKATKDGEPFKLQCTEYCGKNHSEMLANVVIHEKGCLENWLAEEYQRFERMEPLKLGEILYNQRGCATCHSLDGSKRVGPSFNQTYNSQHQFTDGTSLLGDDNYIRESIVNPQAHVRQGYAGVMPTYKGQLSDRALDGLVAFVKSQNPKEAARVKADEAKKWEAEEAKGEAGGEDQGPADGGTAPKSGKAGC